VSWRREGEDLVIVLADNGVGVPPGEKERIFSRGTGRNTGYGLFISREILSITGLSLAETGAFGEGARFEIRVPEGAFRFGKG
jgi:signal transduction histidine kinase